MPEVLGTSKSIYGFDPRSIPGCVLWLDAADSFTVNSGTPANGVAVTSWKDKSGLSNNATGRVSPIWSNSTINGNTSMYLSNVSGGPGFTGTFSTPVTSSALSTFAVAATLAPTGISSGRDQRLVSLVSNAATASSTSSYDYSTTTGIMPFDQSSGGNFQVYRNGGPSTYISNTSTTPFAASMVYDGTAGNILGWFNGAPYTFSFGSAGTGGTATGALLSSNYGIGCDAWITSTTYNENWYGYIGEVLIYSNALTDAQRQAVEGYLAWKWGLNASLPATHAFPLMKPYSRMFALADSLTPWIWFDAADTSTITVSSGTNISSWSNKGAAGGSALSSSGSGTLTTGSTMPNGLNFITFPASARLGFTIGIPNQPRAWFAVFKQTSQVTQVGTGGNLQYFAILNQTTGNGQDSIFGPGVPGNTGTNSYNVSAGASGFISGLSTATAPNGYNVFKQYVWVNSATAASNTITIDGVAQTLYLSCNAASYQTASVLYTIGDTYGNSGQVCEIIQFNSEITTGQRQAVESYLATKWGLASLPSTHPYYVFKPLSAIPFSPTNIPSCIVWLDGDDPAGTGVRPSSGSTVSSWKDKSGQANHFTGFVSTPWTPSLFNGCGGITMSGSSTSAQGSYFQLPAASLPVNVGTTCTFFVMCSVLGTTVSSGRLFSTNYAGQTTVDNADTKTFAMSWSSSTITVQRSTPNIQTTATASTLLMFSIVFDGTNMYLYKSGVLSGTGTPGSATGYAASTGSFRFDTIAIGRYLQGASSGNYSFNGYALEYIMYNQALTTLQRQQVEGYLSAKWQAGLSASHPYYTYFPAQQGFAFVTPSTISAVTLSALSSTGGTLSWTASTNAVEYYWYIGTASGSGTILASGHVASGTLTTSFTATLASSTTYYGWVIPRSSTLTNGATTIGSGSWTTTSYATGGTISTTSGRRFHTFNTNDNFVLTTYPTTAPIEVMCIGGGGGGGCIASGGGGAGNMIIATFTAAQLSAGTYAVSLGTGGGGGTSASQGSNGGNTTFASTKVIALGGGGGGTYGVGAGKTGGCGGGGSELGYRAGGAAGSGSVSGGTQVSNLAFAGGTGYNDGSQGGAGGGGTYAVGASQTTQASAGRDGGAGTLYYGSYYGGGGGGAQGGTYFGSPYNGGAGGTGGGGRGSSFTNALYCIAGTANTGGGGGAASGVTGDTTAAAGGSGICIISYVFP